MRGFLHQKSYHEQLTSKKSFDQSCIHPFIFCCSPGVPILPIVTSYDTVPEVTLIHQHSICTFSFIYEFCHLLAAGQISLTALFLLNLCWRLLILFYMLAKILVIPKLPITKLTMNGKSLPSSSFSPCLKDFCSALPRLTFENLSVVCSCVSLCMAHLSLVQ